MNEQQCSERVSSGYRYDFGGHPCAKPAKVQDARGRWWCAIHTHEAKAAREAKREELYKAEIAELDRREAHERELSRKAKGYDALRAQNARLREALECFETYPCIGRDSGCGKADWLCSGCRARAALEESHDAS